MFQNTFEHFNIFVMMQGPIKIYCFICPTGGTAKRTDPWPNCFRSKLLVEASCFKCAHKKPDFILFASLDNHNCEGRKIKAAKKKTEKKKRDWWSQIVCLMVWVTPGQLVNECHSLPCQGHCGANKGLPWKVYNSHWQEECCLFVMTQKRMSTHT